MAIALGAVMLGSAVVPAYAAPGDHGNGVGGCIDQIYGNNTNPRPSGHGTLPSQSPGPFVNIPAGPNEPPRDDRTRGISIGGVMKQAQAADMNGKDVVDTCRGVDAPGK